MRTLRYPLIMTSYVALVFAGCAQYDRASEGKMRDVSTSYPRPRLKKMTSAEPNKTDLLVAEEVAENEPIEDTATPIEAPASAVQPAPNLSTKLAGPRGLATRGIGADGGGGGPWRSIGGRAVSMRSSGSYGSVGDAKFSAQVRRKPARRRILPSMARAHDIDYEANLSGNFQGRNHMVFNRPTLTSQDPLSTFSIDVDTAAYSIARRSLRAGQLPNASLVRVEELINYFKYDYDTPSKDAFAVHFDGAKSPVDRSKHLLRVGIQSKQISAEQRLPTNIVFLVDTSCSMRSSDKLDLAKSSMRIAVENLSEKDHVAITTYAGNVSLVLPSTPATNTRKIFRAIETLAPSGGTAMQSGMQIAYQQAALSLKPNTNTRVIVLSDGDANIGATRHTDILKTVQGYVSEGVRLTTIGYGDGNYKDETMEQLANKGNGNYYYIDNPGMAARVFGRDLTQMLQDVAQDVKIQVEFNSKAVKSYRLVGYENRKVADRDFRNDKVDAGEIGAGHQVTALYELTLNEDVVAANTLATVRVRAKKPLGTKAKEIARRVEVARVVRPFSASPDDFRFATAVMGASELLRRSPHAGAWNYDRVLSIISDTTLSDPDRREFVELIKRARTLHHGHQEEFSVRRSF